MKDIATAIAKRHESLNQARVFFDVLDSAYYAIERLVRAKKETKGEPETELATLYVNHVTSSVIEKKDEVASILNNISDDVLRNSMAAEFGRFIQAFEEVTKD